MVKIKIEHNVEYSAVKETSVTLTEDATIQDYVNALATLLLAIGFTPELICKYLITTNCNEEE